MCVDRTNGVAMNDDCTENHDARTLLIYLIIIIMNYNENKYERQKKQLQTKVKNQLHAILRKGL